VLLVPGRQVGRAHHAAAAGQVRAALADPGAPVHGRAEVAVIMTVGQGQVRGTRRARGTGAQIGVQRARVGEHPGVQRSCCVKGCLDLAEQVEDGG
jgi:hypothetical protein